MLEIRHTQAAPDLIRSFLSTHTAALMANGAARWHLLRIERSPVIAAFATAIVAREGSGSTALELEFEAPLTTGSERRLACAAAVEATP